MPPRPLQRAVRPIRQSHGLLVNGKEACKIHGALLILRQSTRSCFVTVDLVPSMLQVLIKGTTNLPPNPPRSRSSRTARRSSHPGPLPHHLPRRVALAPVDAQSLPLELQLVLHLSSQPRCCHCHVVHLAALVRGTLELGPKRKQAIEGSENMLAVVGILDLGPLISHKLLQGIMILGAQIGSARSVAGCSGRAGLSCHPESYP